MRINAVEFLKEVVYIDSCCTATIDHSSVRVSHSNRLERTKKKYDHNHSAIVALLRTYMIEGE